MSASTLCSGCIAGTPCLRASLVHGIGSCVQRAADRAAGVAAGRAAERADAVATLRAELQATPAHDGFRYERKLLERLWRKFVRGSHVGAANEGAEGAGGES